MKKVIIFDMMGVIFKDGDDTNDLLVPYINEINPCVNSEFIVQKYIDASLGKITAGEFWRLVGIENNEIDHIQKYYLDHCLKLDSGFLPCVQKLSGQYRIAILSNDVGEWSEYLRKRRGFEKYIEKAFISSELGYRKPEPEIYKIALSQLGIEPYEGVFIDDSPKRVETAEELGLTGILFNQEGIDYHGLQIDTFNDLLALYLHHT